MARPPVAAAPWERSEGPWGGPTGGRDALPREMVGHETVFRGLGGGLLSVCPALALTTCVTWASISCLCALDSSPVKWR